MNEKKLVGRNVAVVLLIVCIILASGLIGTLAYYVPKINDNDNMIATLKSQISQLISNVTNLQDRIEGFLNGSIIPTIPLEMIMSNASAWVNKTVVVEGNLSGFVHAHIPEDMNWDYTLSSDGWTIGVERVRGYYSSVPVRVQGVFRQETRAGGIWPFPSTYYFIEAERLDFL